MCPICGTLLELAESPQAERERVLVKRLIAEGKDESEVKDALVAQYGPAVLALPRRQGVRPLRLPRAGDRLPRRRGRPRVRGAALAARLALARLRRRCGDRRATARRGRRAAGAGPRPLRPLRTWLRPGRRGRPPARLPIAPMGRGRRSPGPRAGRPRGPRERPGRRQPARPSTTPGSDASSGATSATGLPATTQARGSTAPADAGPASTTGLTISSLRAAPRRYSLRPGAFARPSESARAGSARSHSTRTVRSPLAAAVVASPTATACLAGPSASTVRAPRSRSSSPP